MKKINIVLLSIILVMSLASCSFSEFDGSRTGNDSQLILDYKILNKTDSQLLELAIGDIVSFEVVSKSGKVDIILEMDENEPIYKGVDIPTSSFKVEIAKSGKYKCSVIGEKAKGSVKVIKESGDKK